MKVLRLLGNFFKGVANLLLGKDMSENAAHAKLVVGAAKRIAPNKDLSGVLSFYNEYGLPVTEALRDGKLDADEIRALLGLGVAKVIQMRFPSISTTEANLLLNAAYLDLK